MYNGIVGIEMDDYFSTFIQDIGYCTADLHDFRYCALAAFSSAS
jgi:hypothetical protein